ncbi:MAG TPA: helix-turn-helix domain-containing protein [Variovorax sp.]|nr:helix-turn-helix domain-containing protein [Variovorax sp.]
MPLIKLNRFDDFHLHGASAPAWNQRYQQISCGAMRSSLAEATAGEVHVFRKWMSERVVQQGCLPTGQLCFALPIGQAAGTPRMQGHEMHDDSLFLLRSGDEFTLQRPQGMELLAVTFEREAFLGLLDARPWAAGARALLSRPVLRAPGRPLQRLRRELLALFERSEPAEDLGAPAAVFEALGDLFGEAAGMQQGAGSAVASFIVAECHRIVATSGAEPPSIDALCQRLRTSRRTLQNSFRQVADTTPVHFLRSVRLNAVRQRLMSTRPADLSIAQAATDLGFDHLSHLSHRYKTLFGELPSQTLRGGSAD